MKNIIIHFRQRRKSPITPIDSPEQHIHVRNYEQHSEKWNKTYKSHGRFAVGVIRLGRSFTHRKSEPRGSWKGGHSPCPEFAINAGQIAFAWGSPPYTSIIYTRHIQSLCVCVCSYMIIMGKVNGASSVWPYEKVRLCRSFRRWVNIWETICGVYFLCDWWFWGILVLSVEINHGFC